jgi:O-antigen/teichoic acid export membrane protein
MKKTLTFYSVLFFLLLLLQRGSGVLIKIVLANGITPYEYGLISFVALSLPAMFQFITNFNFANILSHSEEGKQYFGFTIVATLAMVFSLSAILWVMKDSFFAYLNLPQDGWNLYYFVVVISLFTIGILGDFIGLYTGLKLYALPGILATIPTIVRLLVIIYLMYIGVTSTFIILLVFALSNIVPMILIFISKGQRSYLSLIPAIHIPDRRIFFFGASIFIIGAFPSIGQYIVKIVLSHEIGILWQGYYDVSLTLASLIMFALGTISYISIPEATNSNKDGIYKLGGLADVTRGFFALTILFVIMLYFYSDYLVTLLFTENYLIGAKYVFILAIGFLFLYIQTFLANLNLSFTKSIRDYIVLGVMPIVLLPFFFILTQLLIPFFRERGYGNGFLGAYVSYTVLLIVLTIATILFCRDRTPIRILFYKIDRMVISIAVTFLCIAYLHPSPVAGIVLGSLLFTFLTAVTGYVNKTMILEVFLSTKK